MKTLIRASVVALAVLASAPSGHSQWLHTDHGSFVLSRDPVLRVRYSVPQSSQVTAALYNTLGQRVATLVDEVQGAGTHELTIDGTRLPSGLYFYRLQAGGIVATTKILLLR
jgi:hypothetical protein